MNFILDLIRSGEVAQSKYRAMMFVGGVWQTRWQRLTVMIAPPVLLMMIVGLFVFTGSDKEQIVVPKGSLPPMHQAVVDNNEDELYRMLLEQSYPTDLEDNQGYTALTISIDRNMDKPFELLMTFDVDVNRPTEAELFKSWTPLHFAALNGRLDMINKLVKKGADLDAETQEGVTPYQLAVSVEQRKAAALLAKLREKEVKEGRLPGKHLAMAENN